MSPDTHRAAPLPVAAPAAPRGHVLWSRAVTVASVIVILFTLHEIAVLLSHYWLLESLDLQSVFWTNFRMGATLYISALVAYLAAAIVPVWTHPGMAGRRRWIIAPAMLVATVVALFFCLNYQDFLFGTQAVQFGESDPVFGRDLGFYVFDLPYLWSAWQYAMGAGVVFLLSSLACAFILRGAQPSQGLSALGRFIGLLATPTSRVALLLVALLGALGVWLSRYDALTWDNSDSSVHVGAAYVDVTGFFSNINYITVTALAVLGAGIALFVLLGRLHHAARGRGALVWQGPALALVALLVVDFGFKGIVTLRDVLGVEPNEPVVQLDYISRHVQATRRAYGLADIQALEFTPNGADDPLPDPDTLLNHPTVRNAPLWPGYASYLERLLDPQHAGRILKTRGDAMIYGPTLDIFQQKQKLRTYYRFLNVDAVRYQLDGEKRMMVSSVREIPLFEPLPWLNFFGQRYMLYTHGFGMVMAPASQASAEGNPNFVMAGIPTETTHPALALDNERIYYGEGTETMAFSNIDRVPELDYPTPQDRAEWFLPAEVDAGVYMDSFLKRLVFGWLSGRVSEFVFSRLITDDSRIHLFRTPKDRLRAVAPFLYYDTNPYAVVADGGIHWLVNALSTSDRYPYSRYGELGDKSDERSPFAGEHETMWVNYVEDSVKATVDAATGAIDLYQLADSPVINTWASVYPGLFQDIDTMPGSLRQHLTYPVHLFHLQFDDLYIYYHMEDPMYFFNLEDMWDDGDEVLGPVMDSGKSITFSLEPYPLLLPAGEPLPDSEEALQYSLVMAFTPEQAKNLRAIPLVYQDWPDYGKKAVLRVPKGHFVMGPEQADAMIDQDPEISQQISWWNRMGMEVIRGHTMMLPVDNEVLYVEPLFLRSEQNTMSQLKRVSVVLRDQVAMGDTLEQALRRVLEKLGATRSATEYADAADATGVSP